MLGTPAFMAPEQLKGDDLDHRADLFAAGMVLLHLVTGRSPYEGASLAVCWSSSPRIAPSIRDRAGDLDPRLTPVLKRALAKQRDDRFETADAFAGGPCIGAVAAGRQRALAFRGAGGDRRLAQSDFIERVERELMEVSGATIAPASWCAKRGNSPRRRTNRLSVGGRYSRCAKPRPVPAGCVRGAQAKCPPPPLPRPSLAAAPDCRCRLRRGGGTDVLVSFIGTFGRILVRQGSLRAASVRPIYDQLAVYIEQSESTGEAFRRQFLERIPVEVLKALRIVQHRISPAEEYCRHRNIRAVQCCMEMP